MASDSCLSLEGTAEWSATRSEPVGACKRGSSILLPSASGQNALRAISTYPRKGANSEKQGRVGRSDPFG